MAGYRVPVYDSLPLCECQGTFGRNVGYSCLDKYGSGSIQAPVSACRNFEHHGSPYRHHPYFPRQFNFSDPFSGLALDSVGNSSSKCCLPNTVISPVNHYNFILSSSRKRATARIPTDCNVLAQSSYIHEIRERQRKMDFLRAMSERSRPCQQDRMEPIYSSNLSPTKSSVGLITQDDSDSEDKEQEEENLTAFVELGSNAEAVREPSPSPKRCCQMVKRLSLWFFRLTRATTREALVLLFLLLGYVFLAPKGFPRALRLCITRRMDQQRRNYENE